MQASDSRSLEDQEKRIAELEQQLGEVALICRTLLTVLRESGQVKPEQFQQVMNRIDLEDGVEDGRVSPKPKEDQGIEAPGNSSLVILDYDLRGNFLLIDLSTVGIATSNDPLQVALHRLSIDGALEWDLLRGFLVFTQSSDGDTHVDS